MGFIVDLAVVSVLWIGATMLIGVIPTIHRHNTTKNLKQTSKDVHPLLTPNETIVHIARQGNISGWNDTVVATDNRIIIHRIKWRWWGKAVFEDVAWEDVQNATTSKVSGFGLAHFHLLTTDGRKFMVGNLVKAQAQALLAICNERIKQGEDLGTEQVDAAKWETLSKKTDSDNPSRADDESGEVTRAIAPAAKSVYCPNCGTESEESAKFCRDCGQALSAEEEKTHDSESVSIAKSQESSDTLVDYMSTKIRQMKTAGEDAPSSPLSSNTEEPEKPEKRGDESEGDTAKDENEAGSRKENKVTDKRVVGCTVAIVLAILLYAGCAVILDVTGWEPSQDCFGSRGEHIFEGKIRSRLSNPDSMKVHMIETEKVEDQPRYAAVAEVSAENALGGRARIRAVGYLEETEDSCVAVIVSMG